MTVNTSKNYSGLDYFKVIAAIFVIAIHTGPLMSYSEFADFLLTSIVARLAVPFFFMVSGFLLFRKLHNKPDQAMKALNTYISKILQIYIISILIYIPVNLYAGHYADGISVSVILSDIVFNGTFYHLWYLPALILGVYVVYVLSRKLSIYVVLIVTGLLYLIGLFGDSYYGLIEDIAVINSLYSWMFSIFDYTRNGLFYAPIFVALGLLAASREGRQPRSHAGYAFFSMIAIIMLLFEGIIVSSFELSRHDSMYVFLVPAIYVIFRWLLRYEGTGGLYVRHVSLWIYILHPLAIVLVRGLGELSGLQSILIENSLIHFATVVLVTIAAALIIVRVWYMRKSTSPQRNRAWRDINLTHLAHNLVELKRVVSADCVIMAVVKAVAYGHGSIEVAKTLSGAGVRYFAVAEIGEGIMLRKSGVKGDILVIGETCESRFGELVKYSLLQTVISAEYGECLNAFGRRIGVHVKIDTGMNRLGTCYENKERVMSIYRCKNLHVVGTYSHLAVADSLEAADIDYTREQIRRFNTLIEELKAEGINPGILHIQSSYGIMNYSKHNYGMVRPGIALYGLLSHSGEVKTKLDLRPVLSLRARVVLVKKVCGHKPIGYGHDCLTTHDSKIATISIGYADGIPRALSDNGGYVLIRGQAAKIMGKICMDHIMVDVTHIDHVERGEVATIIGQDGEAEISAEQFAEQCGTITNEILSRIGSRVERVYG